jgi:hypothetical protein
MDWFQDILDDWKMCYVIDSKHGHQYYLITECYFWIEQ